jgi:hypothetical protein
MDGDTELLGILEAGREKLDLVARVDEGAHDASQMTC